MTIEEIKESLLAVLGEKGTGFKGFTQDQVLKALSEAETASEVARCIEFYMYDLHKGCSLELAHWMAQSIDARVWESIGVLFNPTSIPADGSRQYTVFADGSVHTVQDSPASVSYYGPVDLTVLRGVATVWDTERVTSVYNDGVVYARGTCCVEAHDRARLDLYGHALATVCDAAEAHAREYTFVEVTGGHPVVYADCQSQLLVSGGSADLFLSDCARGVIQGGNRADPLNLMIGGECLVYLANADPQSVRIETEDFRGTVMLDKPVGVSVEVFRDLIVPRYAHPSPMYAEPLWYPLDVEVVKRDLAPFLPEEVGESFILAKTEDQLCAWLSGCLPDLVERGLTGDFLRTHFTEETLMDHHIFIQFDLDAWMKNHNSLHKPCYFFGDQLVHASNYTNSKVYGYEQALVVSKEYSPVKVGQQAHAIVANGNQVVVKGEGSWRCQESLRANQAIGLDRGKTVGR